MTLNQKLSEMAEKVVDRVMECTCDIDDSNCFYRQSESDQRKEIALRAIHSALELPEVKALVEALKHYSNTEEDALWWEGVNKPGVEQNYGKYADEALTTWKQFKGEENG